MTSDVAILVPCHRAEATIARAVLSALVQTHRAIEIVLAPDDGVDYLALLAGLGIDDERVRQAPLGPVHSGPSRARNRALAETCAAFVAPLDADDALAPSYVGELLSAARKDGAAAALLEARLTDGRRITNPAESDENPTLEWRDIVLSDFPIFFLTRRELLSRGWPEELRFAEDLVVNLELKGRAPRYGLAPGARYLYTIGDDTLTIASTAGIDVDSHYERIIALLEAGALPLGPDARSRVVGWIAEKRARNAAYQAARRNGFEGTFYDFRLSAGL